MPRLLSDIDRYVGKRIRLARTVAGLSLDELARQIGVSYQQVQKYENGTNRVGAGRLHQIATVLRRPLPYFFSFDEEGKDQAMTAQEVRELGLKRLMACAAQIRSPGLIESLTGVAESILDCERVVVPELDPKS
jgi:transcriptional regulator with XRE-family HTH domain